MKRILLTALCPLCLFFGLNAFAVPTFTPAQKVAMQKIIHDYIVNNPQVLMEASRNLQIQHEQKIEESGIKGAQQNAALLFRDPHDIVLGNPKGKITLVEFFDYNCEHCRQMGSVVAQLMRNNPKLRVVFKDFPIFGPNSLYAAKAAYAAYKQGRYFEFHDALLASKYAAAPKMLDALAKKLGLNMKEYRATIKDDPAFKAMLKNNFKLVRALKLEGTPAFFVAKTDADSSSKIAFFPGALPQGMAAKLQQMIDSVKG